jgi:1-acyl-sn-glycerol-3-phosphate acyltransferase
MLARSKRIWARRIRTLERKIADALLRFFFDFECRGQQNVPYTGPAIVAANHPSYLDGVLLSVRVRRPIRFMAWEPLFKVPVVGWLLTTFGAFPVSPVRGQRKDAYDKAKALVLGGKVVGMFPEGKRSRTAQMEATVREGAARLAWETGAPLVPATITGAYRAWPYFRSLPRPARIRVRFHPAIDPRDYKDLAEEEAIASMLVEWRRRVDRTLRPGAKADGRISRLYLSPAPAPRPHELLLAVAASGFLLRAGSWIYQVIPVDYFLYLLADWRLIPQRRLTKWLRNTSPLFYILVFGGHVMEAVGLPRVAAGRALAATMVAALLPYFYERTFVAVGFVRGVVFAALLDFAAQHVAPTPLGPHVALPLFAAGYAASRRTVFWTYSVPFLSLYALGATWFMGGREELTAHMAAGAVAWAMTQVRPYLPPTGRESGPLASGEGLAPAPRIVVDASSPRTDD